MTTWAVCVLVVPIVALGSFVLGVALTRQRHKVEKDTIERTIVLRHLNALRFVIDDKIAANEKCETIKTYVDAFIWLLSLK